MDSILDYLKSVELSDIEARLYLTLLKTGPTSVRDLAQTNGIKRTTVYVYIDQLVEKGLIIRLIRGSKKLVAANEPENLKALVDEKLKRAQEVQHDFPTILKRLSTSLPYEKPSVDSEIKNYQGRNSVKSLYLEALKAKELRSLVNIEEILSAFPENAQLFDDAVNYNPNMKMWEIVVESPDARARMRQATGRTKNYYFKFLPINMQIHSTDILIYDGTVSFTDIKTQISAVALHNNDLYNNFVLLFDFIWSVLP